MPHTRVIPEDIQEDQEAVKVEANSEEDHTKAAVLEVKVDSPDKEHPVDILALLMDPEVEDLDPDINPAAEGMVNKEEDLAKVLEEEAVSGKEVNTVPVVLKEVVHTKVAASKP